MVRMLTYLNLLLALNRNTRKGIAKLGLINIDKYILIFVKPGTCMNDTEDS